MVCRLVAMGVVLVACRPNDGAPASGRIVLEHIATSESDVMFSLINETSRAIYLRGSRTVTWAVRTWPGDTGITCESNPPGRMGEDPIGFAHGTPGQIEVSPGDRVRLKIGSTLPQEYKGGRCRLTLRLQDGTAVGPAEFQP
jgi:hypothetical protein